MEMYYYVMLIYAEIRALRIRYVCLRMLYVGMRSVHMSVYS